MARIKVGKTETVGELKGYGGIIGVGLIEESEKDDGGGP